MADLDDLREGSNFGLGVSSQQQSFHVKGAEKSFITYLQPENRQSRNVGF